ncbi:MAG: aspartate kinase, partial [Clostridiales bacterium]|nr:aspartate kinase [Clostridiales bacterium]
MAVIVQKYGGSSVADAERIKRVAGRVGEKHRLGHQMVVVVSAMGDTTDDLIELAKSLSDSPPQREMDMLLATGEQQSAALLAMTLCGMGHQAVSLSGPQAGIAADGVFGRAKIRRVDTERVQKELAAGRIVVVAGFQGLDQNGDINTLGRGGSDTTAAALAIALDAAACEIFTDVSGVYTADPRIVPKARKLASVSYDEMLEMASLGAGVLHPRSVELAKQFGMKLTVRSSFNDEEGTIVQEEIKMPQELEKD